MIGRSVLYNTLSKGIMLRFHHEFNLGYAYLSFIFLSSPFVMPSTLRAAAVIRSFLTLRPITLIRQYALSPGVRARSILSYASFLISDSFPLDPEPLMVFIPDPMPYARTVYKTTCNW